MASISDITRTMRKRMPWPVGRSILVEQGFPRGQGWEYTEQKLGGADQFKPDQVTALSEALREHALCGEKLTGFYNLETEIVERIRTKILEAKIENSAFTEAFPASITDEQIANQSNEFALTSVESNEYGVAAVFSSVRSVTVREAIEIEDMPEAAAKALGGVDGFDQDECGGERDDGREVPLGLLAA